MAHKGPPGRQITGCHQIVAAAVPIVHSHGPGAPIAPLLPAGRDQQKWAQADMLWPDGGLGHANADRRREKLLPCLPLAPAPLPPSRRALGRGAGERGKARAGNRHVPRCQITRVMGSKHVHPKASPSGGVLVALAPLCAFVALLQHPDWAWRLRQPKWIQASRAARRCIPRSWHQTSDSEIGTCDGCNWDGLAT